MFLCCRQKLVEKGAAIAKSMQELRNQHSIDAENLKQLTEDNRQLKLYLDELRAENAIYQANMQRLLNESWMLEFKA